MKSYQEKTEKAEYGARQKTSAKNSNHQPIFVMDINKKKPTASSGLCIAYTA